MVGADWGVVVDRGSPAELHSRGVDDATRPSVRICDPTEQAVVLGSSQPDDLVDATAAAAAGLGVARRRSGGGAVHVVPGRDVWLEIVVPAGHRLADPDVGRAFWWLGDVTAGVLAGTGALPRVHRGGWMPGPWGRTVCFAGVGPGEVTVDGRKVVGISQRRTRDWARLSLSVLTWWDPEVLCEVLVPLRTDPVAAAGLSEVAVGVPADRDALTAALVQAVTSL